jgi:site-specific recombinase XerD
VVSTPRGKIKDDSYKTFSNKQLEEYMEVQTWLKNIGKTSRNVYLSALRRFCNWSGKNPHILIIDRDHEIHSDDPLNRNKTRDLLLDFRQHLEKTGYAPKTINSMDGAIRSFFTTIIGRSGMINLRNYKNASVTQNKDLVPTIEELKKMLDVVGLEEKIRILFIAQTGMRVSDAIELRISDIRRELDLEKVPLAIRFVPKKDRDVIGERVTFLGFDGIEMLKQYLRFREKRGEKLNDDSPLFLARSKKRGQGMVPITQQNFNETIRKAAKKIGLVNGDAKYGRIRVHCLRKFFITQLTNHGVEDKIINFLTCHKISDVDAVYWNRRVDTLRRIYADRQQYLNPINCKKRYYNLREIKGIQKKIQDIDKRLLDINQVKELVKEVIEEELILFKQVIEHDSRIVSSEQEIIEYSKIGYNCTPLGNGKWLMRN